jgi:DNA-binding NarL/FixJ family response regulator
MNDCEKELEEVKKELELLKQKVDIKKDLHNLVSSKEAISELKVFAKKQTVLFISKDEKLISSVGLIRDYFSKFVVVANTYECVECFNNSFDIIVVDVDIEDGEGFELIDKIKSSYPTKVLVALGRKFSYDLVVKMLDLKVDGYLLFPYTEQELIYMFAKYAEKVVYKDIFTDFKVEEKIKQRLQEERKKLERSLISSGEKYKTSAKEYISTIEDSKVFDDLMDNLEGILEESKDFEFVLLDIIENNIYANNVKEMATTFFTHAEKIFFDMGEFDEVGLAFGELIIIFDRLSQQAIKEIDEEIYKHVYILNKNFINLLTEIFITQKAQDIHELDDDFIKSIYSIKEELGFIDESTFDDEELANFIL